MQRVNLVGGIIDVYHVTVLVSIVAHEDKRVLPYTGISIVGIGNGLVNHYLGIVLCGDRETAYSHIQQVPAQRIGTLAIIKKAEESVVYIAIGLAERLFALEAKQVIIRTCGFPVIRIHPVIPGAVTEEQQMFRHIGICLGTVIEHLQVSSVGISVRRTAAELIIKLVCGDNADSQTVVLFMKCCQSLSLFQQLLRSRNDNDHVNECVGMMILICYVMDIFRNRKCCIL